MIGSKKVLSVITARANSKGLPGKNYKQLAGKPLFMWSVDHSINSVHTDLTVVSSNCPHVQRIVEEDESLQNRSDFLFIKRPDELAGPDSKNEDALIHAMEAVKEKLDFKADWIANLQPTSPIRRDGLLDECLVTACYKGVCSSFTVSVHTPFFTAFNVRGYWEKLGNSQLFKRPMRQQLRKQDFFYHDCGSVYVISASELCFHHNRIATAFVCIPVSDTEALQIDTEEDFKIIEAAMSTRNF